jgi:drug/metabolite transporter (DMT)-like permease
MANHIGELAAVLTAFLWTVTALSFETASRRIGSLNVNLLRLFVAFILLGIFGYFTRGHVIPDDLPRISWIWLALSGLVGFVIGDYCLFQSYVLIPARISMLVMTLSPLVAAFTAWAMLGETLSVKHMLGMLLTLGGIAMVVFTRNKERKTVGKYKMAHPLKGILLAFGGAVGQGVGLVLSKIGMQNYSPFASSHIRVITGVVGFAILFTVIRKWKGLFPAFSDHKAMGLMALGSVFGPFLGVSFSLMAVQHTKAGIAQTLMSLTPVLIIPAAVLINKEKVNLREIIGAFTAVLGGAILFL